MISPISREIVPGDSQARTLSFTGTTECVIRVTARKTGYTPKTRDFSLTPGVPAITVTGWGTYGSVSVGGGVGRCSNINRLESTGCREILRIHRYPNL